MADVEAEEEYGEKAEAKSKAEAAADAVAQQRQRKRKRRRPGGPREILSGRHIINGAGGGAKKTVDSALSPGIIG